MRRLRLLNATRTIDIFVNFEANDRLTSIEIWRSDDVPEVDRMTVWCNGIELFWTPADEVLRSLRSSGFDVDEESDPYFPRATNSTLALGFNREGGEYIDEEADDGRSTIFNSVLVAVPGYYSASRL